MPSVLETARSYVAAGFSVVPVRPDGSKAPTCAWKVYQRRRPTEDELAAWFVSGGYGVAIVCGKVSGNLEVLDFDRREAFDSWEVLIREKRPGLLESLPVVATPSGGRHVYCRLAAAPEGNRKLALVPGGKKAAVETRGEGGYVLAPGCPPECHPSGGLYVHLSGPPIEQTPVLGSQHAE